MFIGLKMAMKSHDQVAGYLTENCDAGIFKKPRLKHNFYCFY